MITTDIGLCISLLAKGELVAIPTETVYGLAANIHDERAIKKIFATKGRPLYNPLIVHVHAIEQLADIASSVPETAKKLAQAFWPGPLTMILPKNDVVNDLVTAGKPTVGVRMPHHQLTQKLLQELDFPVAAPSANPFTRVSPTSAQHVFDYFGDAVTILDGGPCSVGLESTIVGFEEELPVIYRKGGISIEAIESLVGSVKLVLKSKDAPVAPGMLDKHYSPRTRLLLTDDVEKTLKDTAGEKVGVLTFYRDDFSGAAIVKTLSKSMHFEEAARRLFSVLHELDALNLDLIVAERLPNEGLGISINDRLERASNS